MSASASVPLCLTHVLGMWLIDWIHVPQLIVPLEKECNEDVAHEPMIICCAGSRNISFYMATTLGIPTRTGKWESIFQSEKGQGILNWLKKSGKITHDAGKVGECQTNVIYHF